MNNCFAPPASRPLGGHRPVARRLQKHIRLRFVRGLALSLALLLSLPLVGATTPTVHAQGSFDCDTVTEIPLAECQALVAFYNSTDGPNWTTQSGWLSTTSPCSWYGIRCSSIGGSTHIVSVSLSSNRLKGDLPPELGDLVQLAYLYLGYNQLTSLPPEIGELDNLKQLILPSNQFSSLPLEIGDLDNLYYLTVSNNRLTSLPEQLGNLPLSYLYASNNQLSDLPTAWSDPNSHLLDDTLFLLDLSYNQFASIPAAVGTAVRLRYLYLAGNQLSSLPDDSSLFNLADLRTLNLRSNPLTTVSSKFIYLSELDTLDLSYTQLTELPQAIFSLSNTLGILYAAGLQLEDLPPELFTLEKLINLDISSNGLSSLSAEISNLSNLQYLHLGNNQLSSLPEQLGDLAHLRTLYLYNNQLSSLPQSIGNLTQLQYLNLYSNQLTSLPDQIGNLADLRTLDLHNNQLSNLPQGISGLTQLQSLHLGNNQLASLPDQIGDLDNLRYLQLYSNQLSSLPQSIGNLAQLQQLILYYNQLTSLPEEIVSLTSLQYLYLQYNSQLSGALPTGLINLDQLRYFFFSGTNLCAPGSDEFQAWLQSVSQRGRVLGTGITCGPPTAQTSGPYGVVEGGQVQLQGYGSDPYGGTLSFAWDLDHDGSFETPGQTAPFSAVGKSGPAAETVILQVCSSTQQLCGTAETQVTISNEAPTVSAGDDQMGVYRNNLIALLGTWLDPAGALDAPYVWAWDLTGDGAVDSSGSADYGETIEEAANFALAGLYKLTFAVTDKDGGTGSDSVMVEVVNRAPQLSVAAETIEIEEGSLASNQGTVADADGDTLQVSVAPELGDVSLDQDNGEWSWSYLAVDGPMQQDFTAIVADGHGGNAQATFGLQVKNVPPSIGRMEAEQDVSAIETTVQVRATFVDPGSTDTHTALWDWGDGSTSAGTVERLDDTHSSVRGTHSYDSVGVYPVRLTVTDNDGDAATALYRYVVVYDPSAGFVTGGGWIHSPAGAYAAEPSLTGRATFGFVSKYQKGAEVPTGETEFQFKAANLNFHSTEYQWLVIGGAKAQYKGTGTVNDSGNYGFMLTAIDADINTNDSHTQDTFRIKIWDQDNDDAIVYDNQMDAGDDADPTTALGGGSIVIHTNKGGGKGQSSAQSAPAPANNAVFLPLITRQ